MDEKVISLLQKCNINIKSLYELQGTLINRDIFLNLPLYESLENDINELKEFLSSTTLTSLQKTAKEKQSWPLLNLIRQLLKIYNFEMKPIRKCNGYDLNKKKKFIRFFQINKCSPSPPPSPPPPPALSP